MKDQTNFLLSGDRGDEDIIEKKSLMGIFGIKTLCPYLLLLYIHSIQCIHSPSSSSSSSPPLKSTKSQPSLNTPPPQSSSSSSSVLVGVRQWISSTLPKSGNK
ncbi:hypothetical protein QVD17_39896 [Tagetes erecta]|uniref:Uncharacterized protein n=1 Tax=Tagetes erecta TaxID=13708 RepID=A0AAD8JPE2_TARER|nr:hypothetical protein QVD17_39896 [Tagetes erecta]